MINSSIGTTLDDADAIDRSLCGDPEAFATVFDRHFPAVFRFSAARLGADLAEDVAAQTFTVAWAERGRYDRTRPNARPWLFGIATNLIRDHRRAERRRWAAYDRVAVERPPHQRSLDDEAPSRVGQALARLSIEDREIILLLAWAELTYDEIAVALNLPVGTVRSRLSRARGRMRDLLALPEEQR